MSNEIVMTNARIVTRYSVMIGTVQIVNGLIGNMDTGSYAGPNAIDFEGDLLLPGIVDIHTDNLERHLQPRPGVDWPNIAALVTHDRQVAAAGITTVFDSLCVGDYDDGQAGRQDALVKCLWAMEEAQEAGLLKSEHLLHLRCEVSATGVVDIFRSFVSDPLVQLVSLMDHTPGQRQWSNLDKWREFTGRLNFSAQQLDAIYDARMKMQAINAAPTRSEVVRICHERGLKLASHDDTTAEHIAQACLDEVSISEFPTTRTAAQLARNNGMRTVMGAPNVVLGGSHSGNVSARELASEGLVDGLASDYVPISLIQGCFLFHDALGMPLPEAVAKVTCNPAEMVGLQDRGEIEIGKRADILRVMAYHHMPVIRGVWRAGKLVS